MAKHLAEVDILGSSFTIKSDESTEYLSQLIEHFSSRVAEARRAMPQADSLRVAIVSGLNITDELFKAQREASDTQRDSHAAAQIATRLIGMIDQTLIDGDVPGRGAAAPELSPAPDPAGPPTAAGDPQNENPPPTAR
ncbi:MAG: cell division protein ZapA [Spirochaetaceae bacterium]|nr:cell division protein ZapA [Spirochaetaceae bacterium]